MEKAKVLIIDDLPENLFVLEEILTQDDREIISATNGNDALKLARLHDFAIILSDVQMPEMDGFELVSLLRSNKKTRHIPVIFLTAINKDDKNVHMGYSEGAVDYIFKPLDPKVVDAKVDTFIVLYRQRRQLEEANKRLSDLSQQKNRFLGMAAHDIRNPLSIIEYYSRTLLDQASTTCDSNEFKSNLEMIYSSAVFIQNLADELLDFTKIEEDDFKPNLQDLKIGAFLFRIIKINRLFSSKKNINIEADFELRDLTMALDSSKMTQVLNNLMSNSIKFSKPGTQILISATEENGELIIRVKDQGLGIPQNEINKLFIPFTTLSVKSTAGEKSTGLGLAIVKKIIEGHKGTIQAESEVGKGTSFNISLPIHTLGTTKNGTSNLSINAKILLLEDNLLMQTLMKSIFESEGFEVVMAENGEEALNILEEYTPDIIFSDINMPIMDGYEFGKKLKELGVNIPLIALTAMINSEIEELCEQAGFTELKEKPISKLALSQLVEKYLVDPVKSQLING